MSSQPNRPATPSYDTPAPLPPGARLTKVGEYFKVCFSRRGQPLATFGGNESEAIQRSWTFWKSGVSSHSTHFSNLLRTALN